MSDGRKLSVSGRGTLGTQKGADVSKVRQSFSHGRSKPVVVERKRRKLVKKDAPEGVAVNTGEAAPLSAETTEVSNLSSQERAVRAEAVKDAIRQAETERMKASQQKRQRLEGEKKVLDEEARHASENKAQMDAEAKMKAEAEAKHRDEEAAVRAEEEAADAEVKAEAARREAAARELEARKAEEESHRRKKEAEKKKPSRSKRSDDRRRSGKLTVTKALEGGDDMRPRSLAAFKRAQKKKFAGAKGTAEKKTREVIVPESITVQELANRLAERAVDVIKVLLGMDVMATINESIDQDTAELVAQELGHTIKRVSESDVEIGLIGDADDAKDMEPRAPVITVMGHVDHGKTSLLDALRKTDVAAGEAGGITQHIGAYQVTMSGGDTFTFLDTPGHEAFTEMRARGASVTDIVILVVAADDGIMPQTIEAINHAKAAEVPIIVAINKMDKDGADADLVRNELLQHEVLVEKMSGEVLDVEISALKGDGFDKLEEAIALQAELMDIRANPNRPADGVVIEARLDKGRGPVATLLVARGTLRVGDIVVAGGEWGKVRALMNDRAQQVETAGPSEPVEILGLAGAPSAGDEFAVVKNEARAREITAYRVAKRKKSRVEAAAVSFEDMFTELREGKTEEVPIVIKADVQGSLEAITQALAKLGTDEIRARVLHGAVGGITESDITLAHASRAPIIGFNVRANAQANQAARNDGVVIQYYSVIYNLVDSVKAAMEGKLPPEILENTIGLAEVKDVFKAGKTGKAAGVIIVDGVARPDVKARLLRDDVVVYVGEVSSLRRFKDEVKEVRAGTECGLTFENFTEIKPGDHIELFETSERQRTL